MRLADTCCGAFRRMHTCVVIRLFESLAQWLLVSVTLVSVFACVSLYLSVCDAVLEYKDIWISDLWISFEVLGLGIVYSEAI